MMHPEHVHSILIDKFAGYLCTAKWITDESKSISFMTADRYLSDRWVFNCSSVPSVHFCKTVSLFHPSFISLEF
jgi:hypothetical protein